MRGCSAKFHSNRSGRSRDISRNVRKSAIFSRISRAITRPTHVQSKNGFQIRNQRRKLHRIGLIWSGESEKSGQTNFCPPLPPICPFAHYFSLFQLLITINNHLSTHRHIFHRCSSLQITPPAKFSPEAFSSFPIIFSKI